MSDKFDMMNMAALPEGVLIGRAIKCLKHDPEMYQAILRVTDLDMNLAGLLLDQVRTSKKSIEKTGRYIRKRWQKPDGYEASMFIIAFDLSGKERARALIEACVYGLEVP